MTATLTARPKVGDKVSVNDPKYPGIWTVKSLGPKNATLLPEHGGRGLRAPYSMLIAPGDAPEIPERLSVNDLFREGEFVRVANSGKWNGLWVVMSDKGADRINLAVPGGARDGKYLRINRGAVTKVAVADVLTAEALAELN